MKKHTTQDRLLELMRDKGLRQVDILEKCKPYCMKYGVRLGRNDLSQYINGKNEPSQKKLTILALALGVNEVWLMGYDVDPIPISDMSKIDVVGSLSPAEQKMVSEYRKINTEGKGLLIKYLEYLETQYRMHGDT